MTADIDTRVSIIENRTAGIENNIADIKLTLENEIRANIERVAEGHFDLSRDLKDAIKTSNEIEVMSIKVRMLETDVRDLKAKLA